MHSREIKKSKRKKIVGRCQARWEREKDRKEATNFQIVNLFSHVRYRYFEVLERERERKKKRDIEKSVTMSRFSSSLDILYMFVKRQAYIVFSNFLDAKSLLVVLIPRIALLTAMENSSLILTTMIVIYISHEIADFSFLISYMGFFFHLLFAVIELFGMIVIVAKRDGGIW